LNAQLGGAGPQLARFAYSGAEERLNEFRAAHAEYRDLDDGESCEVT
jgi:hypothetical protein